MISTINIGKGGLGKSVIDEIKRRLEKEKIVKIKVLKNSPLREKHDKKTIGEVIASNTNSILVKNIGYTYILKKKNRFKL